MNVIYFSFRWFPFILLIVVPHWGTHANLHFAATSFNRIVSSCRLKNLAEQRGYSQLYGADRAFFPCLCSNVPCAGAVRPWTLMGTGLATMATMGHATRRGERLLYERREEEANERECKGVGIVSAWSLNWGSSRRTKRSEAGFTMKEREKYLGFLRNKPWIKVQRPWTWRCGPSNRARPVSDDGSVIEEYASWRMETNVVDVTKKKGNCSRADTADKESSRRIINCTCGFGGLVRDFTTRRSYGCCRLHLG